MKSVLMMVVMMIRRWVRMLKQEKTGGRIVKSFGERSLTTTTDRVEYSEGVIIRVGTIGCAALDPSDVSLECQNDLVCYEVVGV